ncbi:MAG: hypothetical protein PVI78_00305 [Anaerolineales bacterium]
MKARKERDLRDYARKTQIRLAFGAILLFVIGDGLVWWLYGWPAARSALLCTGFGILLMFLITAWLWFLRWFVSRTRVE